LDLNVSKVIITQADTSSRELLTKFQQVFFLSDILLILQGLTKFF